MPTLISLIGVADNLGEPEPVLARRSAILGIAISFVLMTWFCVLFRLYTRFIIIKSPWWDDLFVFLSAISTAAGAIAICIATNTGMGQHIVLLTSEQVEGYLKAFYIANATYPASTAFIKIALLLQYLRMYERSTKLWYTSLACIVFVALWGLAYSVLAWFPTVPVSGYWNLTQQAARYAYGSEDVEIFVATYESHAAINMLLDAVVLGLAVPLFFKSGMRKKSYWGLLCLFVIGGVVNMMSIWRLQSIVETRATTLPTFDPTWYGTTPIVLSSMEVHLATICASLPVFWPILKKNLGPYIMVTHEVKVTREYRRWDGDGETDDNLELRHQSPFDARDSLTSKDASNASTIGRVTSVRVQCKSDLGKELKV